MCNLRMELLVLVVTIFNCLWKCWPVVQAGYTIYVPTGIVQEFISPHPHQYLLLTVFLITTILVGETRSGLFVVLVCFFLTTDDVEHHFMCSLTTRICFLEKHAHKSFPHLKIGLSFHFFNCMNSSYIL